MEDKILMVEALNNTGWTSADAEQIVLLRIRPAMCGSAFTGAHRHHHLDHLVHLVVLVALEEIDALNDREALTEEDRWLLPPSCVFQLHPFFATDAPSSRHVVHRCVRGERCVRVSARAT